MHKIRKSVTGTLYKTKNTESQVFFLSLRGTDENVYLRFWCPNPGVLADFTRHPWETKSSHYLEKYFEEDMTFPAEEWL